MNGVPVKRRVLTVGTLVLVIAATAAMSRQLDVRALQIDPCATIEPTLEPPTETATSEPTSTIEPTSAPDPTSTDVPTMAPDPTSTADPTAQPDSVPGGEMSALNVGKGLNVLHIPVAGADPCETPTAEPTEEETLVAATEEPSVEPTAAPTEEAVTQLPNTGSGSNGSSPLVFLLVIASAIGLLAWRTQKVRLKRS